MPMQEDAMGLAWHLDANAKRCHGDGWHLDANAGANASRCGIKLSVREL